MKTFCTIFAVHKFSWLGTVNEYAYVASWKGKLCDGKFSSATCAEYSWKELQLRILLVGGYTSQRLSTMYY